jgi:transcription-repair coupling factor (superfamily II helicase)
MSTSSVSAPVSVLVTPPAPADLAPLLDAAAQDPAIRRWAASAGQAHLDLTAPAGLRPLAVAELAKQRFVLAVTATGREAEDLTEALGSLLGPKAVAYFPSWETLPHERLSPRADTVGRRLAILRRLAHPEEYDEGPLRVVVAPVRSILQPQAAGLGDLVPLRLHLTDVVPLEDAVRRLSDLAYARVEMVERRGEFAVRGGILDVFPPTEEHPLRVEFFGDEVDDIRYFSVADQRSLAAAPHGALAPPCRELLLTPEIRARAAELSKAHPELAEMLDQLAEGHPVEGMEAFAPVLIDEMVLLLDELPAGAHVVVTDPERVRTRAHDLTRTSTEFLEAAWSAASVGGAAPIDLGAANYRMFGDVRTHAGQIGVPWWTVTPFASDPGSEGDLALEDESLLAAAKIPRTYRGDTSGAIDDVRGWLSAGWRVLLITQGHGPAQRLAEVMRDAGIGVRFTAAEPGETREPFTLDDGVATVTTGCLATGWTSDLLKLAVLTETDLAGTRGVGTKDLRGRMPSRRGKGLDPMQLQPGDLVVHEQHGVGRYVEMVARTVAGATRDYLVLEYARGDKLFVPTDQLEQITRYVGGEGPSLDRIGGADWPSARVARARRSRRSPPS